jgi:TolB-like protein
MVDENNLGQTVSALRRALREAGGTPDAIVTVPGRGFQLALPVVFQPAPLDQPVVFPPVPIDQPAGVASPPDAAPRVRRRLPLIAATIATAVAAACLVVYLRRPAPFVPPPHSLAILPFANLGGDASQTYFADGLADDLIGRLSRIGPVQVAARASAFLFRQNDATAPEIARRLNVASVLEGSVRRSDKHIQIMVRLIDGATGLVAWNQAFNGSPADAPRLENDIAAAVADALHVRHAGGDNFQVALGSTADPAALDAYLRGLQLYIGGDGTSVRGALAEFDAAIARDPNFALAYVKRSATLEGLLGLEPDHDMAWRTRTVADAEATARKAIALASNLGAAHAELAILLSEFDLDFTGALAEAEQARLLAPGDAAVAQDISFVLSAAGHHDEAIAAATEAAVLNPLSPLAYRKLAWTLVEARRFAEALPAVRHAEQTEPAETQIDRTLLVQIALGLGHPEQAAEQAQGINYWGKNVLLAIAYHQLARDADAASALAAAQKEMGDNGAMQYAEIFAQWGRPQDALTWLNKAVALRDPGLVMLKQDVLLDPIANTAGFNDIERRLNFPR